MPRKTRGFSRFESFDVQDYNMLKSQWLLRIFPALAVVRDLDLLRRLICRVLLGRRHGRSSERLSPMLSAEIRIPNSMVCDLALPRVWRGLDGIQLLSLMTH